MCWFTSPRTVAMVFARSVGSEAMYCAGVLTLDGGFMNSSSSPAKCITEHLTACDSASCRVYKNLMAASFFLYGPALTVGQLAGAAPKPQRHRENLPSVGRPLYGVERCRAM